MDERERWFLLIAGAHQQWNGHPECGGRDQRHHTRHDARRRARHGVEDDDGDSDHCQPKQHERGVGTSVGRSDEHDQSVYAEQQPMHANGSDEQHGRGNRTTDGDQIDQ